MILKKTLRSNKAQAIVEYVTLLLVILSVFFAFASQVRSTLQMYHDGVITQIVTP